MIKQAKTRDTILLENYQLQSRVRILENLLIKSCEEEVPILMGDRIYRQIVDEAQDLICRILPDYTVTFANKAMCAFLQKSRDQITGNKIYDLIPDRVVGDFVHFLSLSDSSCSKTIFNMGVDELQKEIWLEWNRHCIFSPDQDLLEIQIVARNISARKNAEEELRLSERRYQNIVNTQNELVACMDVNANLTFVNNSFSRFFNKKKEELLGTPFLDLVVKQDQPAILNILRNASIENPLTTYPWRVITQDGAIIWQEWSMRAIFNENGQLAEFQVVGRDVTERLQMEKALRQSEANYRTIFETTGTAMMIYRTDMKIVLVNSEFEKISGYSRSEIENKMYWTEFIDALDVNKMIYYHSIRQVNPAKAPPKYEFRMRDRWNNIKNIFLTVAPIPENHTVVVSFMDITQRKITEQALKQSEKRFASILNASPNELAISTITEGRFIHVNERFCRSIEWSRNQVIGCTSSELNIWVNPREREELVDMLIRDGHVHNRKYCIRTKSGRLLTTLVSAETLELDGNQCMIVLMNDISELKQMEKEIARLDQLNLVGEIAASIGHEVRNPMTSVRGFLQLLKEEEKFNFYQEYFDLMIDEIDHANHIITEFLSMARHKNVDLRLTSLNGLIEKAAPLIQSDMAAQDKYLRTEMEEIPDIMLDEKEIRQMLLNLMRNGLEAMEAGGKLSLKTYLENNNVVLMVGDEGPGIQLEIMDKIGVPFFTTKEEATGLGLPVCYSIAARHNAYIKVDTSDHGTRFYVYFPLPEHEHSMGDPLQTL